MSRWAPDAAERLERAALELFSEQGYAATTVPQITASAGLTTRTFFRHFTDKREVLFRRQRDFPEVVSRLLAQAPGSLAPLDLVMHGFEAIAAAQFSQWRHELAVRRTIIRSDERLRERELLKSSVLSDAIERALVEDGVEASTAELVGPFAVLVFDVALNDWLDAGPGGSADRSLAEVLRATRTRMQQLI